MKSYCLLLVVLCSAFIIQDVAGSSKLRSKVSTNAAVYVPKDYKIAITPYTGIQARDVGIGADGTIWIISNTVNGKNYDIYRLTPCADTFEKITGGAQRISVAPDGIAWVVDAAHWIYKWTKTTWQHITATAYDISCSPDGNVFHIGTSNGIYMLNRDGATWTHVAGSSVCIAGGLSQSLWSLDTSKNVYRTIPGTWEQVTGEQGTDIAVGANGYVWLLSTDPTNQLAIYDESRQGWVQVPLADYIAESGSIDSKSPIIRIAAAPNGNVIGVRQDYTMFRLSFSWN